MIITLFLGNLWRRLRDWASRGPGNFMSEAWVAERKIKGGRE